MVPRRKIGANRRGRGCRRPHVRHGIAALADPSAPGPPGAHCATVCFLAGLIVAFVVQLIEGYVIARPGDSGAMNTIAVLVAACCLIGTDGHGS
jgi:hypothetical protein